MHVVIAGGGTGGHTSAGLAVAAALRARRVEVSWIGSPEGVEAQRVPAAGIPYYPLPAGKLRRYWDWRNISDLLARVPTGLVLSLRRLRALRPDLLFATGGFVSFAPAVAARLLGIPVVVHEQASVAGLANRLVGRLASKVALTFPEARHRFPRDRVVITGNPLRPELAGGFRDRALDRFGLTRELPVLYVTGGAQGAHRINRTVGAILRELLEATQVIHQCGANPETRDLQWLQAEAGRLPVGLQARYRALSYVGTELKDVYAAADLVVSRAGAGTVNECCHLGCPAVFIPLPGASGDEQTANARILEAAGGAVVLQEAGLSPERLLETVRSLLADPARLRLMGERARSLAAPDAADRITELILTTASGGRRGRAAASP
jgi:UDP-N-acetylglucosamine--N-acetylmuramyl-(pentapeptide) pyrophosphoryl-undecaprenol N-acetylglucosamine transferase